MNQIFKVVFNAARGKKMVVNEATSSVQKGKMAAVTVAVAGALMLGAQCGWGKTSGWGKSFWKSYGGSRRWGERRLDVDRQ